MPGVVNKTVYNMPADFVLVLRYLGTAAAAAAVVA